MRILFTSTLSTSFIREDLEFLKRDYDVDPLISHGVFAPLRMLPHFLRCDLTFTWFASVYSFFVVFLARLLGKPSIIVIGGVDVAKVPEIRYGIWLSPWRSPFVRWALRHAYRVLAVDMSLQEDARLQARYGGENIEYVPTGYDAAFWKPQGEKEPFVLTVAACESIWRMKAKGIDVLLAAARQCPDISFTVVGLSSQVLAEMDDSMPANVESKPFVDQAALLRYYQRAAVYCQPSFRDAFPNSLCEAMLCGCVPVGTMTGGIPTAIRGYGVLVPYGDPAALAEGIRKALDAPRGAGAKGRDYIAQTFTRERREESLRRIIGGAVLSTREKRRRRA